MTSCTFSRISAVQRWVRSSPQSEPVKVRKQTIKRSRACSGLQSQCFSQGASNGVTALLSHTQTHARTPRLDSGPNTSCAIHLCQAVRELLVVTRQGGEDRREDPAVTLGLDATDPQQGVRKHPLLRSGVAALRHQPSGSSAARTASDHPCRWQQRPSCRHSDHPSAVVPEAFSKSLAQPAQESTHSVCSWGT